MKKDNEKRDLILDAMKRLMQNNSAKTASVNDIAKEAGIGKGSIYYYFKSKDEILKAVIERSYSDVIENGKKLVEAAQLDALTKMKIIFKTCLDSSLELQRQESNNYFELQQSALLHQQYAQIIIKNLRPILADIIRQGNTEQSMECASPEEAAEIVLIILTIKLDRQYSGDDRMQSAHTLRVFAYMLESSFHIKEGSLSYLWSA